MDDTVGCRNQEFRIGLLGLGIVDKEATRPMAEPLNDSRVIGASDELIDPVQWIATAGGASAGGVSAHL